MEEENKNLKQRRNRIIAFSLLTPTLIIGVLAVYFYTQYKRTHVSTDDAFVDGRVHMIASKVPGTVQALHVSDNQFVKDGDLILEIDPADYDVKVKQAQAALDAERNRLYEMQDRVDAAKKQLSETNAALEAARATLELQEANLRQADLDLERTDSLFKRGSVPKGNYDKAKTNYDVAAAQVKAAGERIKQVEASLETQRALVKQAESAILPQQAAIQHGEAVLEEAELNKSYTKICAPADGYITKRTVEMGNQIETGQPLLAVVPLSGEDVWITANYKETQLTNVKPGQRVMIKVDTYPGKLFYGKVNSIMAGTGAAFSLFPPENATGNYVKVVQRLPVKIVLDEGTDPDHQLRIGMSVVPTILVGSK